MLRAKYNLNGHSLKGATKMRVFCPEHKRGFFAPRQSPINCEHFCPIDFDREGLERCGVCTRRSSQHYLCDKCHLICFESNTPLDTKNFTLADGIPQPTCPGCLRPASADQHEHFCEELGVTLITALTTCPVC